MINDYRIGQDKEGVVFGQYCSIIVGTHEKDGELELARLDLPVVKQEPSKYN
jgi:hypothetical protein